MTAAQDAAPPPRLPTPTEREAWSFLPESHPTMPAWATLLIQPLPKTTLSMLDLDRLHRTANPLDPKLGAQLRWTAADALGCDYARQQAEADLLRVGGSADDLKQLTDHGHDLPENDRAAIAFARKLTKAAYSITDDEFAEMLKKFKPEELVAMVHTVAFANFEDRIFLALGVEVEPGGPLPPIELKLAAEKRAVLTTPERPSWDGFNSAESAAAAAERPDWDSRAFADLEQAVSFQKKRAGRIPQPDAGRFDNLPPDIQARAKKIVWSNISMGYQPMLTAGWFECMGIFQSEAKLDPVFSNSVFWVVTRTNYCFY